MARANNTNTMLAASGWRSFVSRNMKFSSYSNSPKVMVKVFSNANWKVWYCFEREEDTLARVNLKKEADYSRV